MGPLDSIAQAAGRCNREGLLEQRGIVTVFRTWDGKKPPGADTVATGITENGRWDLHDPEAFHRYFGQLYNSVDADKDAIGAKRQALDFPEVADRFKIIDQDTTPVLVGWREGAVIIDGLRAHPAAELTAHDYRRMQRYVVGLYPNELAKAGAFVTELVSGARVFTGTYDEALGLVLPDDYSES